MQRMTLSTLQTLALFFAGIFITGSAFADKPIRVDENQSGNHEQRDTHDRQDGRERGHAGRAHEYFNDQQRVIIRDYYGEQYRSGRCPPGLAKKHNGCMPPGQAKKWKLGQPLPRDVIFYDLPPSVVMHLGPPPERHRYVRVATDILLIAIGTGMVVDAIEDLGR